MREIDYRGLNFKYGELRQALAALNFEEHTGKNEFNAPFRAFYRRDADALIVVPDKPDAAPLEPIYLRSAERTVEEWNIADSATLFKLLREAAQKEMQAA
jgi:hypothetical protein